jgi:hypothetical protein
MTSIGGRAVRRGSFTADIGTGYPYFFDLRLTAGLWENGMSAFDGGVEIRSFGAVTDVALHGKYQFFAANPLYLALLLDAGGGGGPNSRSTFFGDIGLAGTLSFSNMVSFTARTWINLYTDRFCPTRDDATVPRSECLQPAVKSDGTLYDPRGERDSSARFHLGAWLDVAIWHNTSVFVGLYGAPWQKERIMFSGAYNPVFSDSDPRFYGQIGLTYKQ